MLEDSHKDSNMGWQNLPEADKIVFEGDDAFFEEAWGGIQDQLPQPSRAIGLGWLSLGILLLLSPFLYKGETTTDVATVNGEVIAQTESEGRAERKAADALTQTGPTGGLENRETEANSVGEGTNEKDEDSESAMLGSNALMTSAVHCSSKIRQSRFEKCVCRQIQP